MEAPHVPDAEVHTVATSAPAPLGSRQSRAGHGEPEQRSLSTAPHRRPSLDEARLAALHAAEGDIADRLTGALFARAGRVAIVARRGFDLSAHRFENESPWYTHTAFAYRVGAAWRVRHLLNTHQGRHGHLYDQSLIDFFRDDPLEYTAAVLVPSVRMQDRIAGVLDSRRCISVYTRSYSCIAYPFSTRYMNSNQWILEVLGAAQSGGTTRAAIQQDLATRGFRPSAVLGIGRARQMAVRLAMCNARFDDHPPASRRSGRFELVLESSLRRYLLATDDVRADGVVRAACAVVPESPSAPRSLRDGAAVPSRWACRSQNRDELLTNLPHSIA